MDRQGQNLTFSHKSSNRKKLSILTSNIKNPKGYGRIIRDEQDQPLLIREEQDATKEEKKINEIFSGIMIADNDFLKKGLIFVLTIFDYELKSRSI